MSRIDCTSRPQGSALIQFPVLGSVYNNIVPPSHLPQKANYYLFKVRGSLFFWGSIVPCCVLIACV